MKINKKNIILGLEWLSFQCGEYMGDLQKDRCEISDIPQEYIDLFKDIDTGDSDTDELLEDEQMAQNGQLTPLESNAVQVALDHLCEFLEESIRDDDGNDDTYIKELRIKLDATKLARGKFSPLKDDGKVSCDKCGKFTDERQMSLGTTGGKDWAICWRCESDQGYRICCRDYSCDKCGGDGFIEYDNSSKKEGEVIESYDSEECNKCNGKGTI